MTTDKFKAELKDVIERNIDAAKGFEKAAELVRNKNIAGSFERQATLHKNFALELENSRASSSLIAGWFGKISRTSRRRTPGLF